MDCRETALLIQRDLDGRATPDETSRLAGHVQRCEACARELDRAGRLRRAFAAMPRPNCPPDLASRISASLAGGQGAALPSRSSFGGFGWRQAAAVLLTVALAGLGGWFLGGDRRPTVAGPNRHATAVLAEEGAWVARGVPASMAAEIVAIKERHRAARETRERPRDSAKEAERDERCLAEVLFILSSLPRVLEEYRLELGLDTAEVARLLSLARR